LFSWVTFLIRGKKIEIKVKKKLGGFDFESAVCLFFKCCSFTNFFLQAEQGAQKEKERKERLAREEAEKKRQEVIRGARKIHNRRP